MRNALWAGDAWLLAAECLTGSTGMGFRVPRNRPLSVTLTLRGWMKW